MLHNICLEICKVNVNILAWRPVVRQRRRNKQLYNSRCWVLARKQHQGNGIFCVTYAGWVSVGSKTNWSAVDRQSSRNCDWIELDCEWERGLLRLSHCELLLLEADSWGKGAVWKPIRRGKSSVESRYQATPSEDTAREDLVRAVVDCTVREFATALQLFVLY